MAKKRVSCNECDGEGRIWAPVGDAMKIAQTCPKCKGKKTILVTVPDTPAPQIQPFLDREENEPENWTRKRRWPRPSPWGDPPRYTCVTRPEPGGADLRPRLASRPTA